MSDKVIMVFGAEGKLGKEVVRLAKEHDYTVVGYTRTQADITRGYKIIRADLAVNCAAMNDVDGAEVEPKRTLAYQVNSIGPAGVAAACCLGGTPFVHVSTDYVFGDPVGEYTRLTETDPVAPFSEYGRSKLLGEYNVGCIWPQSWIFRTAKIYGRNGEGLPQSIIEVVTSGKQMTFATNCWFSPTWAPDLARVIIDAFEKSIPYGTYNACGEDACTPYDFARHTVAAFQTATKSGSYKNSITPTTVDKLAARPARRPLFSVLDCSKLIATGVACPEGLGRLLHCFARKK